MKQDAFSNPIAIALGNAKRILYIVAAFSLVINVLMLTAPMYMLQVYDRVLVSRSNDTLLYLTLVAIFVLAIMGVLDSIRSRILVRLGARFDAELANKVFAKTLSEGTNSQALRDLDQVRTFFSGPSLLALMDAPWTPLFLACVYILHPWLGHVALCGVIILFILALINEYSTRGPLKESAAESSTANFYAETSARNMEVINAMGMLSALQKIWSMKHKAGLAFQAVASDRAGIISANAKFLRFLLQVTILGVGAYLAVQQIISPGAMIAASIIMARALAPVESSIQGWRSFVLARASYANLKEFFNDAKEEQDPMPLPVPTGSLSVKNAFATPPGLTQPVVIDATFNLDAGTTLGITGPSAAGKSSLARLVVGIWQPTSGEVRLDGAEISKWNKEELGPHIGFLPQDIELFPGTIAENIARFNEPDPEMVVAAAKLAGAHKTILMLPDGYDTQIGIGGVNLSGGQRQRIGLSRAFYKTPALIVLDEPTSNLDAEGEAAIRQAIQQLKELGKTVVIIAHRPTLLGGVDNLLVVQDGLITAHGPTNEIMPRITRRTVAGVNDNSKKVGVDK